MDPYQLYVSVLLISILHAILPNHWLPVVAISRQLAWSTQKTVLVAMFSALAHSFSTVIIGIVLAVGGLALDSIIPYFKLLASGILIALGILFVWRHQHHLHFHLKGIPLGDRSMGYVIGSLLLAMFFSPCLEVGALFLVSGAEGLEATLKIAVIYTVTSATGMTIFSWGATQGLKKMDWHKLEHSSGLISGIILILTGIIFFFVD